jgi:SEC-C motif
MRGHESKKTGRNELCPCGSGKKYKRCCMEGMQAQETLWQRVHAAFQVVQSELMEFCVRQFFGLKEFAWSDYHFGEPPKLADQSDQYVSVFGHYFLFRWKPHRKKLPTGDDTIAQAFLRLHGSGLSELERKVVTLGLSQPFTFYEVRSVVPGQEFVLKELLTGKESLVKEHAGSRDARPGDIFYGQLAPMRGIATMAFNAGFIIPPKMKPEIIMLRRELQDEESGRALKTKDLLRYEDDVRDLYFYLHERLHKPPVLQNTDGEPFVLQTIKYEIGSAQVAFDALAPLAKGATKEDLLQSAKYDDEGVLREVTISWIKKGNRRMKDWDNTILGTIHISGRSMTVEVNSDERASRIRREIEKRLGLAAVYKTTEVVSIDLEKIWKNRATRPASDEGGELLKDPEALRAVREMLQKQVEGWVRLKIPALGGLTPLQAVKDADGREMVEALVVQQERDVLKTFPDAATRPDMSVLRRLLKLPHA